MTRLLVGMLRRARRLLAEARGVVPAAAQETVSSAAQPVTQPVSSASQAAHALLRAVLAAQRQHAALALFAARQPLSLLAPSARAALVTKQQGQGHTHGYHGGDGVQQMRPWDSTGVGHLPFSFWAHGGYPAKLLDPALVETLCPAPETEETGQPSPVVQASTKRTFQPSLLVRKRRHGFLARLGTANGRRVLLARRLKGRRKLSA